jgi:hypothetical protein
MWIRLSGFMGGDKAVGVYGWLIGGLAVMFVLVMLYAMLCAGPGISPDEEARILAEERRRRELEAATKAERRKRR